MLKGCNFKIMLRTEDLKSEGKEEIQQVISTNLIIPIHLLR